VDRNAAEVRLEGLFAAHAAAVRSYARRRVPVAEADDVVSEVFAVAWRRIDDVPAEALPWLLRCAQHVIAHHYRRERRAGALTERLRERLVGSPAADGVLADALAELGDRDRELLLLIAWDGLTAAEAAKVCGCSRGALAVRLHRARRRLAAALHRRDREQDDWRTARLEQESVK
jgi:RNA polymerase sigma-70 factor (ECF subfamily)